MGSAGPFRRLVKLYKVVENLHALQAKAAALAAQEIERTRARSSTEHAAEVQEARRRFIEGNRVAALASDHAAEGWGALQRQLRAISVERTARREAAAETHRQSEVELRQIERVVEKQIVEERAIEVRRAQSESDDRFLSRREWLRLRKHGRT